MGGVFDWFRRKGTKPSGAAVLPRIDRESVRHLFVERYELPQVDWGMADLWITRQASPSSEHPLLKRAIVAAWLEELRDTLTADHQAWRTRDLEGLTPLDNAAGKRVVDIAARSRDEITRALKAIRGDHPIPPYAIIALKPLDAYLSFKAHFVHDDDTVATSGGFYIAGTSDAFPILAINAATHHAIENTVAHELTHHALVGANLPLWAEEGITQMMEERVAGGPNFTLNRERAERQRERWEGDQLEMFIAGQGFSSPHEDDQELSYHLSQWAVRAALDRDPKTFFAFLRACRTTDPEAAAANVFGCSQVQFVRQICGIPDA